MGMLCRVRSCHFSLVGKTLPQSACRSDHFSCNWIFLFSNIAAMVNYGATFAVAVLLSLYLQYIREFSAEWVGLIFLAANNPDYFLTHGRNDFGSY